MLFWVLVCGSPQGAYENSLFHILRSHSSFPWYHFCGAFSSSSHASLIPDGITLPGAYWEILDYPALFHVFLPLKSWAYWLAGVCMFQITVLYQICLYQIPGFSCPFIFLMGYGFQLIRFFFRIVLYVSSLKRSCLPRGHKDRLLFPSRSFIALAIMFRPIIYLELIFVYGGR